MAEQPNSQQPMPPEAQAAEMQPALDAAGQSLSSALRTSFRILTVMIVVLATVFLGRGFFSVQQGERVLVLRYGRTSEAKVFDSKGLHYAFPYPIDELVRISVINKTLEVNSFWPKVSEKVLTDAATTGTELSTKPVEGAEDAYMLTGDLNVLQARWKVLYHVDGEAPNIIKYFKKIGSISTDIERRKAKPEDLSVREPEERLLRSAFQSAILRNISSVSAGDVYPSGSAKLAEAVYLSLQEIIEGFDCGIVVDKVIIEQTVPPADVKPAFDAATAAGTERKAKIADAEREAARILIETAGDVGIDLGKAVSAWWDAREAGDVEGMKKAEQTRSELFAKATGEVYGVLAEARTYSTRVEQEAKSDKVQVEQLAELLEKSPQDVNVFLEHVRIEAVQEVLANCYEKFVLRPEQGDTKTTLELWLNRRGDILREEREIKPTR